MRFKGLLVILGALFLAACNPMANLEEGEAQITKFERLYSKGQDDALFAMTGEKWREVSSREEFDDLLKVINARLGKIVSSERSNFNVNTFNGVTTTVIAMDTEFEQGKGTQVYTFQGGGEDMELVGWTVNSPRLIITADDLAHEGAEPRGAE